MAVTISKAGKNYDWYKLAIAGAEAAVQSIALGKLAFGNPIPAFFRIVEGLRGEDPVETRALKLVTETLTYAIVGVLSSSNLKTSPQKAEIQSLIENYIERYQVICEQNEVLLDRNNLENPITLSIFKDAEERIYDSIKTFYPSQKKENVEAMFRDALAAGISKILARNPSYFLPVVGAINGPGNIADARNRAWSEYKSCLIKRFEDATLFAHDSEDSPTLGQVYQPLRVFWKNEPEEKEVGKPARDVVENKLYVGMLESEVLNWLNTDDKLDRIRLISGGPGSGKSSFAKRLAAIVAMMPSWRILFIPLQRLKGSGNIEIRIDEYFRHHLDEPFEAETLPLSGLGRDGYSNWLVIFDGLDELAKEGSGSETAAQEFASSLIDWKARIGEAAKVKFIILGRAPSMQEARKRLSLHGDRTLNVSDMLPIESDRYKYNNIKIIDKDGVAGIDQRGEFWTRWATANKISVEMPEGMVANELKDLTKEPLLAYLLIISGYVSERWKEAAENRNRVYRAIFDKIWERERIKEARHSINDMGKFSFDALMQALGIAAWRGGGRTGDENTFIEIRDVFMRPDLLKNAKRCGAAELDNVALLFYTRKDEEQNRGYEFLHKSFGEYLTACGLFDAFRRWGKQVMDPVLDFDNKEFLERWMKLTSSSPMTDEISEFLNNEVRLYDDEFNIRDNNSETVGKCVEMSVSIVNYAIEEGMPVSDAFRSSREFEVAIRNSETSLWAVLNACACAAYPMKLLGKDPSEGGWSSGPIQIPAIKKNVYALDELLRRSAESIVKRYTISGPLMNQLSIRDMMIVKFLSRINADNSSLSYHSLVSGDLDGASFKNCHFDYVNIVSASCEGTNFEGSEFLFSAICFSKSNKYQMIECKFKNTYLYRTDTLIMDFTGADLKDCMLGSVDAREIILSGASIENTKFIDVSADLIDLEKSNVINSNIKVIKYKNIITNGTVIDRKSSISSRLARRYNSNNVA